MSETPETTQPIEEAATTAEVIESVGFVKQIRDEVATGTTKALVYAQFVGVLVKQEIDSRAALLQKAFDILVKHASELNKIKPKSAGVDENGVAAPKLFTPDEAKKRKEIKEKVGRLEQAISKALADSATKDDWTKLNDAVSKNG